MDRPIRIEDIMADIKAIKDAVWLKEQAIKKEEKGLEEWETQVRAPLVAGDVR